MKRKPVIGLTAAVISSLFVLLLVLPVRAEPIEVTGLYHFRDNRSANSINIFPGDRLQFGAAKVVPDGYEGTVGTATMGAATLPLLFHPYTVAPHVFETSVPYIPQRTGQWKLTFTNESDTTIKWTPSVGTTAPSVDFVKNLTISGSGTRPTFTWTLPAEAEAVTVRIWDLQRIIGQAGLGPLPDMIYLRRYESPVTTFTLPFDLVQHHAYSFEVDAVVTRGSGSEGPWDVLSQSRSFFDLTPMPPDAPPNVYLPTVTPGPIPVYTFHADVVEGQQIFIDPLVAVGYDYMIGNGDPWFASVTMPAGVQTDPFDLYLFDGTDYYLKQQLGGGETFTFDPGGVDRFRILGIDPEVGLDPLDSTAFITGLTFAGSGQFTGTMTPITFWVPEPATSILLAVSLLAPVIIGAGRRK